MSESRKKVFLLLLGAAVLLGCKAKESAGNSGSAGSGGSTQGEQPRMLLVTDSSGENDASFNHGAFSGILSFYGETWNNQNSRGRLYDVVRCKEGEPVINLKAACEEKKWDIIVTTGFSFAGPMAEVAPLYPAQRFMIVDVDWLDFPNVMQYTFAEHEGSYLVGAVAALKAIEDGIDNPVFGFIGGIPSALITKFEVAYIQGIWSIIPGAKIVDFYTNSWDNTAIAQQKAEEWYNDGVFIIFTAAGSSGNGAIAQTREERRQGNNVWIIGVDSDQYDEGLYASGKSAVLTSMVKKVETTTMETLTALQNNSFKGDSVRALDLAQEGVGFATTNTELSQDIIGKVNAIQGSIINKNITVISTYRDALGAGLVPAGLLAIDD
jgi:basic membrane protein A